MSRRLKTPGYFFVTKVLPLSNIDVGAIVLLSRKEVKMAKIRGLLAKWCAFWRLLDDAEKLIIMRMIGYRGGYPSLGVSPLLMARLLRLSLECCHKSESKK